MVATLLFVAAVAAYEWELPAGFPAPLVPAENPLNPAKAALGAQLFGDRRLSVTGEYACASCHDPARAFTDGMRVPRFFYGTAWKEDRTQQLTELALGRGFRGIDTANQRRHYDEAAVGRAIAASIAKGLVVRDDIFLQTKFTFRRGQDHRLPYDPDAPVSIQVDQSLTSSLGHLGVEWVDSLLLHGPTSSTGLTPDDWAAWGAMEAIHDTGRARMLGVSNFNTPWPLKSMPLAFDTSVNGCPASLR